MASYGAHLWTVSSELTPGNTRQRDATCQVGLYLVPYPLGSTCSFIIWSDHTHVNARRNPSPVCHTMSWRFAVRGIETWWNQQNPSWSFACYWPLWLEHIAVEPGWFPGDGLLKIRNWKLGAIMVLVSPLYEGSKDNLSRPMAKWIQVLFIFIRLNLLLLSCLYPTACWHALYLASFEVHVHYFLFLLLLIVWKCCRDYRNYHCQLQLTWTDASLLLFNSCLTSQWILFLPYR